MLIDEVLAEYEASLRREVVVEAPMARVYAAIVTADLHGSLLLRVFRPPSGWLDRWHGGVDIGGRPPLRLLDLRRFGVLVLADRPAEGVALGAIARLWSVRPAVQRIPPDFFAGTTRSGFVKVAATVEATPMAENLTLLACEIRFLPLDKEARRRFRAGWPVGWLLTRLALREIMAVIERRADSILALAAEGG